MKTVLFLIVVRKGRGWKKLFLLAKAKGQPVQVYASIQQPIYLQPCISLLFSKQLAKLVFWNYCTNSAIENSVSNRTVRVSANLCSFMDACHEDQCVLFVASKNILVFSFEKVHRVESNSNRLYCYRQLIARPMSSLSQSLNPFPGIKPSRSTRRPLYTHLRLSLLLKKLPHSPP